MKVYKAMGNGRFNIEEIPPQESPLIKVKVMKILPTRSDHDIFTGKADKKYPLVPCSMATGVISESRPEYGLKRGQKVILNPYTVPNFDRLDVFPQVTTYGYDKDGFLADYALLPVENIIPFPEEMREDEAIFAGYTAIALAAINCFGVEKGDYVAILGASALCNLIAQYALYLQAIPIVIDSDPNRLRKAGECGIYYTVNSNQEVPYNRVLEITGGRMAEHTIMESDPSVLPQLLFTLTRQGGDCTIVSVNGYLNTMEADINLISSRRLKVKGVSHGATEFNSAVYLIAQKNLKLSPLIEDTVTLDSPEQVFNSLTGKSMATLINI